MASKNKQTLTPNLLTELKLDILANFKKRAFRPTVSNILLNDKNEILIVQSAKGDHPWSFPQGGIEEDEADKIIEASQRELREELGIKEDELILESYLGTENVLADIKREDKRGFLKGKRFFFLVYKYVGKSNFVVNSNEIEGYKWVEKSSLEDSLKHTREVKRKLLLEVASTL